MRILFTEGSSLSARQTLYALGGRGHVIDVCDPKPIFCLARFSRFVRHCFRCPSFTADPAGYLRFLLDRLKAEKYDVLLPVHDQVFLLARFQDAFRSLTGLALPSFAAVEQMQSKAGIARMFEELRLPHPATVLVRTREELHRQCQFPCYIKLPYSTAGCGVWRAEDENQAAQVAGELEKAGHLDGRSEVLVQQAAPGVLCVAQSVFQRGRLVAAHCYRARALGVGGSARARVGVHHPQVLEHLARLGAHLGWHGALNLEYLHNAEKDQLNFIEVNPRIGETVNATLSGVNLAELLVQVSLDREEVPSPPPPKAGVQTHSLVMGLLALGQNGEGRLQLAAELLRGLRRRGLYEDSQDEITWIRRDWLSMFPAGFLIGRLLLHPGAARNIVEKTVDNYSLSEAAVAAIRGLPAELR